MSVVQPIVQLQPNVSKMRLLHSNMAVTLRALQTRTHFTMHRELAKWQGWQPTQLQKGNTSGLCTPTIAGNLPQLHSHANLQAFMCITTIAKPDQMSHALKIAGPTATMNCKGCAGLKAI